MSSGVIAHDGKFGADWVNLTIGDKLIAKVMYQSDGSQRDNAERFVRTWNEFSIIRAEHGAMVAAGPKLQESATKRQRVISTLTNELNHLTVAIQPGMTPSETALLVNHIRNALDAAALEGTQ